MTFCEQNNNFQLDDRLASGSFFLIDWPLSRVLLKNNASYPWFILVPRVLGITEITQLTKIERYQLIDEIEQLSIILQDFFHPNKLNFGSLGNIVAQFHMHIVARFYNDPLWPHGIWQSGLQENCYMEYDVLIERLVRKLSLITFD